MVEQKVKPLQEKNDKCLQAIRVLIQKLERTGTEIPADISQLLVTNTE